MKKFEQPEMTAIKFTVEDVLTTSGGDAANQDIQGVRIEDLYEVVDK